jgi:antitoxin (DNA-binding transcriptional repressor) of toxin-antitoxin stability system
LTRRDAHYLHERAPLEAVLAVHAERPRCASWAPDREVLLVADARGQVVAFEPTFGTRPLFGGPAEPVQVASRGDQVAVLSASGRVEVRTGGTGDPLVFETGLQGESGLRFWAGGVAVIGEGDGQRTVRVFKGGREVQNLPVPPGTALGVSAEGELRLARSVASGMRVVGLGADLPTGEATGHVLRFSHAGRVLGVAEGGATLWHEGRPHTARLLDAVSAALCADGRTVALGTRGGVVALADILASPASRAHPPRVFAHGAPVRLLSFANRGRWLATIGDNCRLWTY